VPVLLFVGVQVDLINLIDLQMLQGNDEGLELATVPTDHGVRPEVVGQEGDKFDSELIHDSISLHSKQPQNFNFHCFCDLFYEVLVHVMKRFRLTWGLI